MAIVVQLAGILADFLRLKHMTTTGVRKLFTCGAFTIQTMFIISAAFISNPAGAITALTIAVGLGGFAWAGFR
jgi:ACS family sodium-dependent inorganic phosphate cotransporter